MIEVSDTYRQLFSGSFSFELKVVLSDGSVFNLNTLKTVKTYSSLFDGTGPSVGGTVSTEIDLELYAESSDWPRMAQFSLFFRLLSRDGLTVSEWIQAGTFFTDTRSYDVASGVLSIHGYDGMLTLETTWLDKLNDEDIPITWPITAAAAVDLALSTTGFELDERSVLDNNLYIIGHDSQATVRDTLAAVAAAMGGNWTLTNTGKLRLVPLKLNYASGTSAVAGIAIAGLAIVGTSEGGSEAEVFRLGMAMKEFSTSPIVGPIISAELTASDGTVAAYPQAGLEYCLKADCEFSSSAAAGLCYNKVYGFEYRPFEARSIWLDPSVELGDFFLFDGTVYPVYAMDINYGAGFVGNISAPYEAEVDHEYQVVSKNLKNYRKSVAAAGVLAADLENARVEFNSTIQQTATQILQTVSEDYYDRDASDEMIASLGSQIVQTADSLEINITRVQEAANAEFNSIKEYVRYEDGVVIVGTTEHTSDFRVSPLQVAACYNGEPTSYWNQNEQVTPKKLRIPSGGSLQEGDFIWQPRSSGNLSLMWIGGN